MYSKDMKKIIVSIILSFSVFLSFAQGGNVEGVWIGHWPYYRYDPTEERFLEGKGTTIVRIDKEGDDYHVRIKELYGIQEEQTMYWPVLEILSAADDEIIASFSTKQDASGYYDNKGKQTMFLSYQISIKIQRHHLSLSWTSSGIVRDSRGHITEEMGICTNVPIYVYSFENIYGPAIMQSGAQIKLPEEIVLYREGDNW